MLFIFFLLSLSNLKWIITNLVQLLLSTKICALDFAFSSINSFILKSEQTKCDGDKFPFFRTLNVMTCMTYNTSGSRLEFQSFLQNPLRTLIVLSYLHLVKHFSYISKYYTKSSCLKPIKNMLRQDIKLFRTAASIVEVIETLFGFTTENTRLFINN